MAVDKQVKEKCWVQLRSKVILILLDDGERAYGNTVYTEDENGDRFAFCHLDEIFVKEGQDLPPLTPIGTIGSTGYCPLGPHLHYSQFPRGNGYMGASTAIDPEPYIKKNGSPCRTAITNKYNSNFKNPKLKRGHEGIDFSSWRIA